MTKGTICLEVHEGYLEKKGCHSSPLWIIFSVRHQSRLVRGEDLSLLLFLQNIAGAAAVLWFPWGIVVMLERWMNGWRFFTWGGEKLGRSLNSHEDIGSNHCMRVAVEMVVIYRTGCWV